MSKACRCEAAAGRYPSTTERDTQGQQQKSSRAEIGQEIAGRDAAAAPPPIYQQDRSLDNDYGENEIDEPAAGKQFSHD
jgi:hypothetical protein